jgi:hypothetical protein
MDACAADTDEAGTKSIEVGAVHRGKTSALEDGYRVAIFLVAGFVGDLADYAGCRVSRVPPRAALHG